MQKKTSTQAMCAKTAMEGNLVVLRRFVSGGHAVHTIDGPFVWTEGICTYAACGGHLQVLIFLREECACPWDALTTRIAAFHGHLDCLRYAVENHCPCDQGTIDAAAAGVQLHCLQYLRSVFPATVIPWTKDTVAWAAQGSCSTAPRYVGLPNPPPASQQRTLECVAYLLDNGCPSDVRVCGMAAHGGQMLALKYAREQHGCAWNETTTASAAKAGRLECLAYLRENGCPWNAKTLLFALTNGHMECFLYAREHGCPCIAAAATPPSAAPSYAPRIIVETEEGDGRSDQE